MHLVRFVQSTGLLLPADDLGFLCTFVSAHCSTVNKNACQSNNRTGSYRCARLVMSHENGDDATDHAGKRYDKPANEALA